MTLEQWADLDEDEPGELVDGRLVEEEVPTHLHEIVVAWLIEQLRRWARPRGGWVFGSEHKLALGAGRGRKPDVTLYRAGAPLRRRDAVSRAAPDLVVEVVSPRPRDVRRDRLEKLHEYAQLGVRSYWLIDPEARLVEMCVLGPDGLYVLARSAAAGKVQPPELEDLELDLDDLWAEADGMPDGDEGGGEHGE
ncbi:MAG: Uma2 family endonuclease [Polyangiaceae bacterium]|nr:Uma2 family endonuclease [Polyangiaceae bacterium]